MIAALRSAWTFLAARLNERSTWTDIGAGLAAAAALPVPYSYVFILIAIVKTMVPDGPVKGGGK